MKHIILICLLIGIATMAMTQNTLNTPNTQEWIDFDKTYYKIKVAEDGIYRIDYSTLIEHGFPEDFTDAKRLSLINEGEEIPLFVSDTNNWVEGEYLEFYGKQLDGQFDQHLFENPEDQLHPYWSQFADTAVYFLNYAEPSEKIIEIENDLSKLPGKEEYFMHSSVLQYNRSHSQGVLDALIQFLPLESYPGESRAFHSHFASYSEGEGWMGYLYASNNPITDNSFTVSVNTPFIFDTGGEANITFKVLGLSRDTLPWNHHLQVFHQNQLIVEDKFEDYIVQSYNVQLPVDQLTEPKTHFEFIAVPSRTNDRQALSHMVIDYPRSFEFDGVDHFSFTINHKETGNYLEFENLYSDEVYWLYDITHLIKIKLEYNAEKELHQAYLPARDGELRTLILQKEDQIKIVNTINEASFINYSEKINQGDYIIITHPNLISKDNAIDNYINYRSSYEGGNYKPVLVNVENLYDQYSYGIRKHPLSIKYFLNEAIENWEENPTHCLLLGKGIKNSKCRFKPAFGESNWHKNLVPTFGDTPNDQYFGAKEFNPLSRIAIGRLSVDNEEDIQHYLDKVIAVEQDNVSDDCNYINEAQWMHQLFHISGGDNLEQMTRFQDRLNHQANIAENGNVTANTNLLNRSNGCQSLDDFIYASPQQCLDSIFSKGRRIVNFLGHASGLVWELNIGEPEDYIYNQKYPVIISHSSFTGDIYKVFYDEETRSMPEIWLNAQEAGSVAFVGFNHIFEMHYGADLIDDFYEEIFKLNPNLTLGEQFNAAVINHYNETDSTTLHATNHIVFAGDPALKYSINTKPELTINESDVSFMVNQINDFYYAVELVFEFNSLNIPSVDFIPYNIVLLTDGTETEVSSEMIKASEQGFFKKEFTLLPNQSHIFRIQLDHNNQFDEICEKNNTFSFNAGKWVGIEDDLYVGNSVRNHPNPFSKQTIFDIHLAQDFLLQETYLTISNSTGQLIYQIALEKGISQQQVEWNGLDKNGSKLSSGVYTYQIKRIDDQHLSLPGKVVLIR